MEQAGDEARGVRGAGGHRPDILYGCLRPARQPIIFAFVMISEIGIDLSLTDERVDLVREGVDIALRLGPLTDSSLKLRALGQSRRLLVASPDYLAARGRPVIPPDLSRHEGIRMSNVAGSETLALQGAGGELHMVPFVGRLRIDHGLAAREALVAGRGIAPAHRWLVDDLLAAGLLETILVDYSLPSVPLNMLIVPERGRRKGPLTGRLFG